MNLSLYLLTVLIWGTTWIALKLQLGEVAIAASIAYRFALAAAVLFAVLLLSGRLQKLDKRGQLICLAQGLCLFCINFMCFYTASQWIPSGLVAVIFSTATLWNAINARLFFKQQIAANVLAGGALGLGGLALLFWPELAGQEASRETLMGIGLALIGTLCFSAGNMLSSLQQKAGLKPLTTNAWGMLYGALMLVAICLVSGTERALEAAALTSPSDTSSEEGDEDYTYYFWYNKESATQNHIILQDKSHVVPSHESHYTNSKSLHCLEEGGCLFTFVCNHQLSPYEREMVDLVINLSAFHDETTENYVPHFEFSTNNENENDNSNDKQQ